LRGDTGIVALLIRAGAAPDPAALHIAAARENAEIVRLLIEAGADPGARDGSGSAPLDEAAFHGSNEVAALLMARGAQAGEPNPLTGATPLNEAAAAGNTGVVALLLSRGADTSKPDNAGATPLENAARARRADVVKLLLDHDPGPAGRQSALLDEAVLKGDKAMVRMLTERGADVNTRGPEGATPLHDAALKGYAEIASILIGKGADVNARDAYGATPLHDAAVGGSVEVVRLLIEHGADVNARESDSGATPLYDAASMGREGVVSLLLAHGADPNIPNNSGHGALHAASGNGFAGTAAWLRTHGAADDPVPERKISSGR
jgi:ankyrin repeat protein